MSSVSPACACSHPVCPVTPRPRIDWRRWLELVQSRCTLRPPPDSPFASPAHARLQSQPFLGGHLGRWSAK